MTHRVAYNGYIIEAHPHQLADDSRWTMDITIQRHDGDRVTELPFSAANLFDTEEEARITYDPHAPLLYTYDDRCLIHSQPGNTTRFGMKARPMRKSWPRRATPFSCGGTRARSIHGFFTIPGTLRVAREAMNHVAGFLRFHLGIERSNKPLAPIKKPNPVGLGLVLSRRIRGAKPLPVPADRAA